MEYASNIRYGYNSIFCMLFTSCLIIFYGYLPGLYEWIRKCVIDNVKYESLLKNCCGRMDDIYIKQKNKQNKTNVSQDIFNESECEWKF